MTTGSPASAEVIIQGRRQATAGRQPIDRIILAGLKRQQLAMKPPAAQRTLLVMSSRGMLSTNMTVASRRSMLPCTRFQNTIAACS